jgi:metallo-beta-lactamase family protein
MRITCYGAAGEVTGSCFLVEAAGRRLLVDCGLFQGMRLADLRNHAAFPFSPSTITAVLLTHSHADHSGRIPKLVHDGFLGKIYATAPTAELTTLLWKDNFEIMRYDHEKTGHPMVFEARDIEQASSRLQGVSYHERLEIQSNVFVTWFDAGHILGSSFLLIEAEGKRLVFSGDQGNRSVPILHDTEPLPPADALFCEATYGASVHEDASTREEKLLTSLRETIAAGGVLMIPSFAIERTQELLYDLNTIVEKHQIPFVPIFLDSPLGIDALAVYRKYRTLLRMDAACIVACGDDFFQFPGLTLTRSREESKRINMVDGAKVIIAGAGMMNGGRIQHHLLRYLPDPKSEVLIIGYQAAGTLGRHILDGETRVTIFGEHIPVRARVRAIGAYSAHADKEKLLSWIAPQKNRLQKVVVIHSDKPVAMSFAEAVNAQIGVPTVVAGFEEVFEV